MIKTPILRRYESKQADINDQLCYYLFSDAEVVQHLRDTTILQENQFTTEIFTDNKYAERLHVKIGSLTDFRKKSFNTYCGITLISSFEYLLSYIEEIQDFRAAVSPSEFDQETNEKPEIQLEKKLNSWVDSDEVKGLIKTINYLRLRRNHIAHVRDSLTDDLKSLIKNHSNYLNTYWGKRKTNIFNFDFSKDRMIEFDDQEIFAIVNMSGVCMKIVDELVVESIDLANIIKYELVQFEAGLKDKYMPMKKRLSKFNGYLESIYGRISVSEMDYKKYVGKA